MAEEIVPQWKRDLIERRRALGRAALVGSLQFTCPGVVSSVRQPDKQQGMRLPTAVPDIHHLISEFELDRKSRMGEEKTKKLSPDIKGGGGDDANLSDSSEEFKYGPGIVSKLKSKYLSLTLRESHAKIRPSLSNMRRATSLENILDENEKSEEVKQPKFTKHVTIVSGNGNQSRRGISRNKENMKRARSVEALVRYNKGLECQNEIISPLSNDNSRNRISVEEKELPPPDLVKQTLKIFEPVNAPKASAPLIKASTTSKIVVGNKPLISPKPHSIDKALRDIKKSPTENGHGDVDNDKLKNSDLCSVKERKLSLGSDVEIIENLNSSIVETSVMAVVKNDADSRKPKPSLHKDQVDDGIHKSKEFSSSVLDHFTVSKERPSALIQRSSYVKDRPAVPISSPGAFSPKKEKHVTPVMKEKPSFPSVSDVTPSAKIEKEASPSLRERQFFPDFISSPKNVEIEEPRKHAMPNPLPRNAVKGVERRQIESPLKTPPVSSEVRSPLDMNSSPGAQMKQVGVIRPIVTQKSPQQPHNKFLSKTHSDRELEKNLLNKVKCVEQPVTKVIVSLKKSAEECTVAPPKLAEDDIKPSPNPLTWSPKPNTIVFNFSNRKNVPDYIENDGLILSSRKERSKTGDGGLIHLPGGTDDFSTDFDADDSAFDPPSPCRIQFIGDNVLINGKSSLQKAPKQTKMRIKFNEEAPTLYEYPSEASLLEDLTLEQPQSSTSSPAINLPLKSSSLSSYTPSKVSLSSEFELGVTRSQAPPPPPQASHAIDHETCDEEQYLRPADDANTVAWSAETVADLLF